MDSVSLLKQSNIAITDLRLEMLEILRLNHKPLSFDEFHLKANKTTFYRNMELFEERGIVIKTNLERKSYYELAQDAKAHFICDVCHKITDFALPKSTTLNGRVKSLVAHGICNDCE